MTITYSPSTKGFYHEDQQAPEDAIAISDEDYETLLVGQTEGKSIVPGEGGSPTLVEPTIEPEVPPTLSFIQFLSLFTLDEQMAIVASADPKVKLFLILATGATYVDLDNQQTKDGTAYLVSQKLITPARAAAVLAGKPPS